MITTKIANYLIRLRAKQKIGLALSRAAATAPLRTIDPTRPSTWEFSGFSQNGEDGITDYLVRQISNPNRRFIEIGAADGIENLTAWFALGCRYSGIIIEGSPRLARQARLIYPAMNLGVDFRCQFVDKTNVKNLAPNIADKSPDLFSLSGPEQNRTKTVQNRTETEQRWIGMGVQPCRRPERSGGLRQGCRCALALLRRRRAGKVPAMKTSNWSTAIPSDLSAASSKISTRVLSTPPLPPHIWG